MFPPGFLAEIRTDRGQFPPADLRGSTAVFTPGESGPVEMLTERKTVNMHEVLDKYSCYGREKTQPSANVLRISMRACRCCREAGMES